MYCRYVESCFTCEFVPQKYPGEELLLVYDYEFKYGQNFYLCLTEEAKERILHVRYFVRM